MTAPATYTFIVTAIAEQDAKAAHAARYTHDDATMNREATVQRARIKGEVVWITRLFNGAHPTVYVTQDQAARLGLCHCGKPAQVIGFEGLRCNAHAKGGMSLLCTTPGCTNVSHTGFSSLCNRCITPAQREAYEVHQQRLRTEYANKPYRY